MAIASKGALGVGLSGATPPSTTTLAIVTSVTTLDVGDIGIVVCSADNTSTTDGDNSELTGVTDTAGNTWTKLGEYTNSPTGAAADGVTCSVWQTRATSQLVAGGTITITYGTARVDKAATAWAFTVAAGSVLVQSATAIPNEVNASNHYGSVSFSGLPNIERLWLRGFAKEANATTSFTPTTGFTSMSGGRSQNLSTAVLVRGEFEVLTATGNTSNPNHLVSGDTAAIFFALEELSQSPVKTPSAVSLVLTGLAPVALIALLPAAAALTFTGYAPALTQDRTFVLAQAALVFAGPAPLAPIQSTAEGPIVPLGALTFQGLAPSVFVGSNVAIPVPAGTLKLKGPAATSPIHKIPPATLALTGQTPLLVFKFLSVPAGSLTLTGKAPLAPIVPKGVVPVGTAVLTLSGQYVGQGFGLIMPGTLTLTGYQPVVKKEYAPTLDPDVLALTGLVPKALVTAIMAVPPAALTVTGQPPQLVYFGQISPPPAVLRLVGPSPQATQGIEPSPTLTPGPASLVLTGMPVSAGPNVGLVVPVASLVLAGRQPTLAIVGADVPLPVPAGSLTLQSAAGTGPVLQYFWVITPAPARLRLLGPDPEMAGIQFGIGKMSYPSWQSVINS